MRAVALKIPYTMNCTHSKSWVWIPERHWWWKGRHQTLTHSCTPTRSMRKQTRWVHAGSDNVEFQQQEGKTPDQSHIQTNVTDHFKNMALLSTWNKTNLSHTLQSESSVVHTAWPLQSRWLHLYAIIDSEELEWAVRENLQKKWPGKRQSSFYLP